MSKSKIQLFSLIAVTSVLSALLFTNAASPTYNFLDFLPLNKSITGQFYVDKKPLAFWVVSPAYGTNEDNVTQIQFRNPETPDVWLSDVWEYNKKGPFGWDWAYLIAQGERKKDDTGAYIDNEYKIKSKKTEIVRYVNGKVYSNVFDYTATAGMPGIPYARMSWDNYAGVGLKYVVKNSYVIENARNQVAFLVYHEQEFVHNVGALIEGPSWAGVGPKSREYLLLSEAYWQYYILDPNYYQKNPDKNPWLIGGLKSMDGLEAKMETFDVDKAGKYAWPSSNSVTEYGRKRYHAKKTGDQSAIMGFRIDSKTKDGSPITFGTAWTSDNFSRPQ